MYNLCLLFHTGLSDMHNYFAVGKEFVSLEWLGKLKQLWAAVSTHSDLDMRKNGHIDVCACVCVVHQFVWRLVMFSLKSQNQ